ncbi:MAG: hypothetical protein AAFV19_12910 [Pseudomonadota bacterium]
MAARELKASKKPMLAPHLSQDHNDPTSLNAFWGFAIDRNAPSAAERVVGAIGARMDQIPKGGITDFWYHHYARLRNTDYGGLIDRDHVPPHVREIEGKVVNFGDYFLLPKKHDDQSTFMMAVLAFAEIKWSPDVMYAFLREGQALSGQSYRLGFQKHCRGVHRWVEPPKERKNSDTMIYSMSEDTAYAAALYLQGDGELSEIDRKVVPLQKYGTG